MTDPSTYYQNAVNYWNQQDVVVYKLILLTITCMLVWWLINHLLNIEDGITKRLLEILRSAYPLFVISLYLAFIAAIWSNR